MDRMASTEFVTMPEAQRRTGLGLRQLRRAVTDSTLAVYDVGGWPRLRWREVLAWIESTRRPAEHRAAGASHTPVTGT